MAQPIDSTAKRKRDEPAKRTNKIKRKSSGLSSEDGSVPWDELAETKWGKTSLTRFVAVPELDRLVGWATHVQQSAPVAEPNVLLGITSSSPLQPSLLRYLENTASYMLSADKRSDQWESLHQSALVSIGIVLEEMLTATLLPLAQRHVKRCRNLEDVYGSEEQVFSEWTLPPEEAIEKLLLSTAAGATSDGLGGLATAHPSTRSTLQDAVGTSVLNQPSRKMRNQQALSAWCKATGLDISSVQSNKDILRIFLPHSTLPTNNLPS